MSALRGMILPFDNHSALVPRTVIAEIIPLEKDELQITNHWFLGLIKWRDIKIPAVNIEAMDTKKIAKITIKNKLAILNVIEQNSDIHFYGNFIKRFP